MVLSRRSRRTAAAALMIAGLSLVAAPLAAAAHTGKLFTWGFEARGEGSEGFATLGMTNPQFTFLAPDYEPPAVGLGADICDDVAWGVGLVNLVPHAFTWNHDTGVLGTPVSLTADLADFPEAIEVDVTYAWAADTLPGCGLALVFAAYTVSYEEGPTELRVTVSSIDWVTGAVAPIIELPVADGQNSVTWTGIASDPTTGTIYLFANVASIQHFSVLTLEPIDRTELQTTAVNEYFESQGQGSEADFQPDGKLWMIYGVFALESYRLLSFAPGADLLSASPTDIGALGAGQDIDLPPGPHTLTYDPALLPVSGGTPLPVIAFGGALLLGGAVLLGVHGIRRRDT